jgi:hypothetical protein
MQTYCLQRDRTIMSDMLRGQAKMMDYDAICTFVFKDYKDFAKFMFVSHSFTYAPRVMMLDELTV